MTPRTEKILIILLALHLVVMTSIAISVNTMNKRLLGMQGNLSGIEFTLEHELPDIERAIYGANSGVEDKLMDIWGRLR